MKRNSVIFAFIVTILWNINVQAAWDFDMIEITDVVTSVSNSGGYNYVRDEYNNNNILYQYNGTKYGYSTMEISIEGKKERKGDAFRRVITVLDNGYTIMEYHNKYGIMDTEGNFIFEPVYNEIHFIDGKAIIHKDEDKNHFLEIDEYGNILREFDFDADDVYTFSEGRAVAKSNWKIDILDEDLNVVKEYPYLYDRWDYYQNGYLAVYDSINKCNIIDKSGNMVTDFRDVSKIEPPDENGMCILVKGNVSEHFADLEYGCMSINSFNVYKWYKACGLDKNGMYYFTNQDYSKTYMMPDETLFANGTAYKDLIKTSAGYYVAHNVGESENDYTLLDENGNVIKKMDLTTHYEDYNGILYEDTDSEWKSCIRSYDGTVDTGYIYDFVWSERNSETCYGIYMHPYLACRRKDSGTHEFFLTDTGEFYKPEKGTPIKCKGDYINKLSNGNLLLDLNGRYYLTDPDGIILDIYDTMWLNHPSYKTNENMFCLDYREKRVIYDNNGNVIAEVSDEDTDAALCGDLYVLQTESETAYYDMNNVKLFDDTFEGMRDNGILADGIMYVRHDDVDEIQREENGAIDVNEGVDFYDASWSSIFPKRYKNTWRINSKTYVCEDFDGRTFIMKAKEDYAAVRVNGKAVKTDQSAVIRNDRTLVPMRAITEALGGEVEWDEDTLTVNAKINGSSVRFVIGSKIFTVDGEEHELDVPAQLINDRTMLPVRAISEAVGAHVSWNQSIKLVSIEM